MVRTTGLKRQTQRRCCRPAAAAAVAAPIECCVPEGLDPAGLRTFRARFQNGSVAPFLIDEQSPLAEINPSPGPPAPDDDPAEVVQLLAPSGAPDFQYLSLLGDFFVRPSTQQFCMCYTSRVASDDAQTVYAIGMATPGPAVTFNPQPIEVNFVGFTALGGGGNWISMLRGPIGNQSTGDTGIPADATPHDFRVCGITTTVDGITETTFSFFIDDILVSTFGQQDFSGLFMPYIAISAFGGTTADLRMDEYCVQSQ